MSEGNTMIGNVLVGHALEKMQPPRPEDHDETCLGPEDEAVVQEEEHLLVEEAMCEEEEKEQEMLAVALVNSVVETSTKPHAGEGEGSGGDASPRYSLRKRRRPAGSPSASPQSPSKKRVVAKTAALKPPDVKQATTAQQPASADSRPTPAPTIPSVTKATGATEAVPACTVAAPAAPLTVSLPVPSSLPTSASLPPALQPPLPPKPAMTARPAASAATRRTSKSKRVPPAAKVTATTSKPLSPNPAPMGVPNPLSIPLPASKTVPVGVQTKKSAPQQARAKAPVPCPLPSSTYDDKPGTANRPPVAPSSQPAASAPASEKKKVTIAPEPEYSRGRIFSVDLDPASLDFSVLDSGESGTIAPASADLPLLTGGGRDRAFSFECFAFGINAEEPLSTLPDHAVPDQSVSDPNTRQSQRPRGDSIIFDPASFQEGGIHEERALTTREARTMSMDLDAIITSASDPASAASGSKPSQGYAAHPSMPATMTSKGHPPAPPPPQMHYPDHAASNPHVIPPPPHPGAPHGHHLGAPPPQVHHHHPPHVTTSGHHHHPPPPHHHHHSNPAVMPPNNPIPQHGATAAPSSSSSGGVTAVSVIGACAASTTLQMELLNKGGRIGIYLPEARKERIARFHAKRKMRIWRKRIKYDCRKKLADSRPRIKGRFVKRTDTD